MASDNVLPYEPTYRQKSVDTAIEDHEQRITANEKRWLVAKGAIATLATIKGMDFALGGIVELL